MYSAVESVQKKKEYHQKTETKTITMIAPAAIYPDAAHFYMQ